MNIKAYLDRINLPSDPVPPPTLETLQSLHSANTLNVPFENLDPYFHRPVLLDETSLYHKIVEEKRGGYCFELNGLFSLLLKQLNFEVTDLLARVAMGEQYGAKLHEVLMVTINQENYLADVGFGSDGIVAPLLIRTGEEQSQYKRTYRFSEDPTYGYVLERKQPDDIASFVKMYAFTKETCIPLDFQVSSHYTSTSPQSFFTMMPFATIPTTEGRITLTEKHLKQVAHTVTTEEDFEDETTFKRYLKQYFALDYDKIKAT
jgi:N-hydroxyarylamine O-acetyltransferase